MKIQFGMIVTGAVGRQSGQLIQRFKNGYILRKMTMPTQRLASIQNKQRTVMSYLFSQFNSLSAVELEAWAVEGSKRIRTDPFGQIYTLTARECFTRVNALLYPYENSLFRVPPPEMGSPYFRFNNATINKVAGQFSISASDYEAIYFYQVKVARMASVNFPTPLRAQKTLFRFAVLSNSAFNFDQLQKAFAPISEGQAFIISIRGISTSGVATPWQSVTTTVV